ncbi:MAG: response regulator [Deltaproteobacteria bacterium]|nr:response regulator [Deltaproteobacteria bacterium]
MGYTMVLAEDEEHVAKIIIFKLGKAGFNVVWKDNGIDALKEIEETVPDIVLLDVMMPGMNGFEVLEKIKSNDKLKDIPTVMLTAMGQEGDTVKGFDMGAVDYIIKPFRPAELLSRVNRILKIT